MTKGCIAVFAKTPELSPVKTRLADTIGQERAKEIYILCIECIQETLSQQNEYDVVWALAEESAINHGFWQSRPFNKIWTGGGELGTRLHQIYSNLKEKYAATILIGTDSPQISSEIISDAIQMIKNTGFVIGPAHDGGYYLFGGTDNISKDVWEAVPYSESNTRKIFLENLGKNVEILQGLSDLDVIEDVSRIIAEMPKEMHASQKKLKDHLEKL